MCDVKEVRGHTTMVWYVPSMCIVASGSSTVVIWLHQHPFHFLAQSQNEVNEHKGISK
jgi:hypothetical protein